MAEIDTEKLLTDIERKERKAWIRGLFLTLIPLAVGVSIILYAGHKLKEIQGQVQGLKTDADTLTKKRNDLLTQVEQASTAVLQVQNPPVIGKQANTKIIPLIYIQIRDESQRVKAKQIVTRLREQGYVVPGIERVDRGPTTTQVKFFRSDERGEAANIADILQGMGVKDAKPQLVPGFEHSTKLRARQYEIWFGPNDLKE